MRAEQPLPGVVNSFIGNDPARWHANIPTAAQVRYTDLYPGLDFVVYGTDEADGSMTWWWHPARTRRSSPCR